VIFDPERKETISINNPHMHHMNVDYSLYEGFEVQGVAETVISRGKVVVEKNNYIGKKGDGKFLKRGLYGGLK
jgi:dihydropyrimidinase